MRRTEIISETTAAETMAAEAKAGKGRLSGAKKAVTAFCGAAYLAAVSYTHLTLPTNSLV